MRTISKKIAAKITLLLLFIVTQFTAWADTGEQMEESRWSIVAGKPEFWVGIVLFIGLMILGTVVGKKNRELEMR